MFAREITPRVPGVLALAALLSACGSTRAPRDWLPRAAEAGRVAYGGWAIVEHGTHRDSTQRNEGELIAVSADSIWLLADSAAYAIPAAIVRSARVTGYDAQPGAVTAAAAAGALATISNGFFLVFTMPAWFITGSLASRAQARHPVRRADGQDFTDLASFARFPQGLPPGLDVNSLRRKERPR